jgi:hypothetical protein
MVLLIRYVECLTINCAGGGALWQWQVMASCVARSVHEWLVEDNAVAGGIPRQQMCGASIKIYKKFCLVGVIVANLCSLKGISQRRFFFTAIM